MMRAWAAMLMAGLIVGAIGCDDTGGTNPNVPMDMGQVDPDEGPEPEPDMAEPEPEPDEGPVEDMGVEIDVGVDMGPPPEPCTPCEEDEDCAEDAVCLFIGDEAVCSVACDDGDCPDGYTCVDWEGSEQCVPEPAECLGCDAPGEAEDICDGFDNDCDGTVDEDFVAETCGEGACVSASACIDGVIETCEPTEGAPDDATCDGIDEDCDGLADEDYVAESCGEGLCVAQSACDGGEVLMCVPDVDAARPRDITCDAVDDDCDGRNDEDFVGRQCGIGACAAVGTCEDGVDECVPGAPLAEQDVTCNGTDEDCDGNTDEDFVGAANQACGFGLCRAVPTCDDGAIDCQPLPAPFDIDQQCDGLDEDCDGEIDENCVVNSIGLVPISFDDEFVTLDVVFNQEGALDANNAQFFQPRLMDLYLPMPDGLDVQASLRATVAAGQAAIDAEKQVAGRPLVNDPRVLRIQVLSQVNANRIGPGVIARITLARTGGTPPWAFAFDADLSSVAPEEAADRLEFGDTVVE